MFRVQRLGKLRSIIKIRVYFSGISRQQKKLYDFTKNHMIDEGKARLLS